VQSLVRIKIRRALIYTHRWLGIAGGLLFVAWFASGIVMMYVRMPELEPAERIDRLEPLDLSSVRVAIADAAAGEVEAVRVNMLGGRAVYRFALAGGGMRTIYADSGELVAPLDRDRASAVARRFAPDPLTSPRYASLLTAPDQWTLGGAARRALPLHRVAVGDGAGTEIYVSLRSGEAVMRTTARERRLAYFGPVLHWLYFTPIRQRSGLWTQLIIWLAIGGCALSLSGLVWGMWRLSLARRYRVKREYSRSPYSGLMRWHHYAGLAFGAATFTWVFSGLLSMDPWDWHPGTTPARDQRERVAGGPLRLTGITVDQLRGAAARLHSPRLRELELIQFQGQRFLRSGNRLVSLDTPGSGVFARFSDDVMRSAARAAVSDAPRESVWLNEYDAYYYDRARTLALPVLRVRYADSRETWLYFDPGRGAIARREERLTRANRWLYHGLHSLDFPRFYASRPLWDIVVILLSAGGLAVSATTLVPAGHRLKRHARRLHREIR
jgi:hypothetical protein